MKLEDGWRARHGTAVCVAVVLCAVVGAIGAAAAVPTGTWVGRAGGPIATAYPLADRASYTITVGAQTLNVVAVGPTGASHDSAGAKATCTWRYRFEKEAAGWRLYKQVSGTIAGAGGIETAPCSTRPEMVARIRRAGAKLKVEFGLRTRVGDSYGNYLVSASRA